MTTIQRTDSPGIPHGSFQDEFLSHKKGSEWWYCTGFVTDEAGKLYSFQFTLARVRIYFAQFHILMTALSDFENQKHYYAQQPIFFGKDLTLTADQVAYGDVAAMGFSDEALTLNINDPSYTLALQLTPKKAPVWHCEDGKLQMGIPDPDQTTYYWSYTNLAASGTLTLGGETFTLQGQAWFDKQGGTYTLTNRKTNWEWFSMRFFNGEEIMLFSFPQDDYQDGTFINKEGGYQRLNDYVIEPTAFTEAKGKKFSNGWQVTFKGIKDEAYDIIPKMEGQLNLFYYELLADIKNKQGETVGYCVTELLPGVYNEINPLDAFVRAN
jgi:predicted secreted hydrolase